MAIRDALNIYFKGGWGALPIEYNYQVDAILELVLRREQEELARKNGYLDVIPKIIHYTSKFKPWKKNCIQCKYLRVKNIGFTII